MMTVAREDPTPASPSVWEGENWIYSQLHSLISVIGFELPHIWDSACPSVKWESTLSCLVCLEPRAYL
jgi:hypothetical protein